MSICKPPLLIEIVNIVVDMSAISFFSQKPQLRCIYFINLVVVYLDPTCQSKCTLTSQNVEKNQEQTNTQDLW